MDNGDHTGLILSVIIGIVLLIVCGVVGTLLVMLGILVI